MSPAAVRPSPSRFSIVHLMLFVPWVALGIAALTPIRDNSFLWHIRAGSLQASAGEVLVTDPFSFTMNGERWLTQSWLAELLYAWGEDVSGLGFVGPMIFVFGFLTLAGIALIAYRRSQSLLWTVVILYLSTLLFLGFLVPRPVIISYALAVAVVLAWDRPSTRWTVPLLFWVWASIHGSFALGLAYIGLTILAKKDWRALSTAVVSGLVTLLTAHGWGVVEMLIDFSQAGDALALISEWGRPSVWSLAFTPFLVGVALLVVGGARRKVRYGDVWLIIPFLALALGSTRAIPPAWIALVPLVSISVRNLGPELPRRFGKVSMLTFGVVVGIVPFLLLSGPELSETRFPIAATAQLENVNTFHDDRAGGYLIYEAGPEFQVYLDDRAELYGDRMVEFVAVRDGETPWEPVFERDGIEQALLRADQDLVGWLIDAGWAQTYQDEEYVVLRP